MLLTAALAVALLPAPAGAAAPDLQVSGNKLIDATTGAVFVPRGANWPSFEYACHVGYAYSEPRTDAHVGADAAGAAQIASWHINTIRIPLNQDCWLGDDGFPAFGSAAGYRQAVKDWVDLLHAQGIAVILDLHWSGPDGTDADGQRAMADDRSDDFWTSVATLFKDDPAMIFDAFNEPYSRDGFELTWDCWLNGGCQAPRRTQNEPLDGTTFPVVGMQALINTIRATGATQPIVLSGRDYANDLGEFLQHRPVDGAAGVEDDQLIAGFHNYDMQVCKAEACWNSVIAPIAAQMPVVTTEFGTDQCNQTHVDNFMNWADARDVGYLMWAWWVLKAYPDCAEFALLADVDGTPRFPNGTALKAHLTALAQPGADTTPPETAKQGGPKRRSRDRRPTFEFGSEAGAQFGCRLDEGPLRPCQSPYSKRVKPGRHKFVAAAVDAAGNVDPTPASWRFKVLRKRR